METILCNDKLLITPGTDAMEATTFSKFKIPRLPLQQAILHRSGDLFFFEMQWAEYTIQYYFFNIKETVKVSVAGSNLSPSLLLNFWGSVKYASTQCPHCPLGPFRYCLDNSADYTWESTLKRGRQYSFLHILFPVDYFESLIPDEKMSRYSGWSCNAQQAIPPGFGSATTRMVKEADKLVQCDYESPLKELYLEQVIKALLLEAIDRTNKGDHNLSFPFLRIA